MNKPLTITAYPVKQEGVVFYLTSMKAGNLIDEDYYRIDRWNPATQEGYQREINQTHAHRISRYLGRGYREGDDLDRQKSKPNSNNTLPASVVINFRHPLSIHKLSDKGKEVEITIESQWPGYFIDGQHRVEGARELIESGNEEMIDYEFPVALTNFTLEEEMMQFRNLNSTANRPARGLNQSIAYALQAQYGRVPASWSEAAQNRVTGITMRLASDQESPWYGRIALGGIRKRAMHSTVQAQFSESIQTIFIRGRYSDPDQKMEVPYETIRNYWEAVEEVWPRAAESEASVIFRPLGFFPLNRLLDRLFNNIALNPTKEDFVEILTAIRGRLQLDDEAWAHNTGTIYGLVQGYSSNRGYTIVADYLWSGLDEATKTKIRTKIPVR